MFEMKTSRMFLNISWGFAEVKIRAVYASFHKKRIRFLYQDVCLSIGSSKLYVVEETRVAWEDKGQLTDNLLT